MISTDHFHQGRNSAATSIKQYSTDAAMQDGFRSYPLAWTRTSRNPGKAQQRNYSASTKRMLGRGKSPSGKPDLWVLLWGCASQLIESSSRTVKALARTLKFNLKTWKLGPLKRFWRMIRRFWNTQKPLKIVSHTFTRHISQTTVIHERSEQTLSSKP